MKALLEVRGLVKTFASRRRFGGGSRARLTAVDGVDLAIARGECLALVGESGSGKTTLARLMLRLLEPDRGDIRFAGEDLRALPRNQLRHRRKHFQLVFQNPAGALDPRMRVGSLVAEPLRLHRIVPRREIGRRVASLLATVGLAESVAGRYPHQLSGGQRQRLAIARALATEPRLLILDEPVSALDVSVRAQLLGLLAELQERLELALLFIAHDLAMVERIADRVAVLYLGRLVEIGPRRQVFDRPRHPYTASLLAAVPVPDPDRRAEERPGAAPRLAARGDMPSAWAPPSGCAFHPRCPLARRLGEAERRRCIDERPVLVELDHHRSAACHYPEKTSSPVRPA